MDEGKKVKFTRKVLQKVFRFKSASTVRSAIKRGNLIETRGMIDVSVPQNQMYLQKHMQRLRSEEGIVVDFDLEAVAASLSKSVSDKALLKKAPATTKATAKKTARVKEDVEEVEAYEEEEEDAQLYELKVSDLTAANIEFEYKKAQTVQNYRKAQMEEFNLQIKQANYISVKYLREALNTYFSQFLNTANVNLNNVVGKVCRENGITEPSVILRLKAMQSDVLNDSVEAGLDELMKVVDRAVEDQRDKFVK